MLKCETCQLILMILSGIVLKKIFNIFLHNFVIFYKNAFLDIIFGA